MPARKEGAFLHEITLRYLDCMKVIMKQQGMKDQRIFERETGMSLNSVGKMRAGRRHATVDNIYLIHTKYHVSFDYLYKGTGNMFTMPDVATLEKKVGEAVEKKTRAKKKTA